MRLRGVFKRRVPQKGGKRTDKKEPMWIKNWDVVNEEESETGLVGK